MNIYLLSCKKGKYLLYSNQFQTESLQQDTPGKPQRQNKLLRLMKSGYKTATAKRNRSEKLLKEMTALSQITLYYPANLPEDKAHEIYHHIIQSQIRKHKRWLIVDGALLPFSAVLTLIPGPNVLMAYLAWRALMHYKTKKGGEAMSQIEVSFVKNSHLEDLFRIVNKRFVFKRVARIRSIGGKLGIAELESYPETMKITFKFQRALLSVRPNLIRKKS